jgi:hypothetical protein
MYLYVAISRALGFGSCNFVATHAVGYWYFCPSLGHWQMLKSALGTRGYSYSCQEILLYSKKELLEHYNFRICINNPEVRAILHGNGFLSALLRHLVNICDVIRQWYIISFLAHRLNSSYPSNFNFHAWWCKSSLLVRELPSLSSQFLLTAHAFPTSWHTFPSSFLGNQIL